MTITYEISPHFIHEIKAEGYDVNVDHGFRRELMRFMRKKEIILSLLLFMSQINMDLRVVLLLAFLGNITVQQFRVNKTEH